MAGYY